jgi:flavin reductase (DIM6/NTAB) family NADH-FMN oxidoreductase RutF
VKKRILSWLAARLRPYLPAASGAPPTQFIRVAYHTPRQVVLLTARHEANENVWPIDWHMPVSIEPHMYAISLTATGFGTELVQNSQAFVVNFVPAAWEETIFFCGRTSGRAVDKFAEAQLRKAEAVSVNAPYLPDALGRLECQVVQMLSIGDRLLFIADVSHAEMPPAEAQLHHLDGRLRGAEAQFGDVGR